MPAKKPMSKPAPPKPKPAYSKEGSQRIAKRNVSKKNSSEFMEKKGVDKVSRINWDKQRASTTDPTWHGRYFIPTSNDVDMGTRYMGLKRANPSRGQDAQDMQRRSSGMRRNAAAKSKIAGAKNMAKRGAKRK